MPSHWGHKALNIVSQSSPTGTQVLQAIGAAEAGVIYSRVAGIPDRQSRFHGDEIVYVSLGDGATSEGEFWESLNTACTKSLPVLFLVEDNGYAISVPVEVQTPGGDISRLVRSLPGLHVDSIDGTDFLASLRALGDAAAYVRARSGPALVHARVVRPYSHSLSDDEKLYRPPAERDAEARRDPIARFAQWLREQGHATDADLAAIAATIAAELNAAADAALSAEKPARTTATLWLYSPDVDPTSSAFDVAARPEGKPGTMVDAINRTLKDEMARDARIVVFGEDVADASRKEALPLVKG
jgi:2-oxoisovalerate dehydrogenase E1 component